MPTSTDYDSMLSDKEINQRLHKFNLTNNWSVFRDVPPIQQVSVMYPYVIRLIGSTDEQHKQTLINLFGPLEE